MTQIVGSQHALTFGVLDLLGHDTSGTYWFNALGDGTEWGNPEQITRTITTFLQDGALELTDSYGNREMTIEVKVIGKTSAGLAAGEAALFAEVGERNTLTWTPPNTVTGFGVKCVFDVVNSRLDHAFDDMAELRLERRYKLTVKAYPWARSETMVTVTSPAAANTTPAVTVIDACNATTGWAGSPTAPSTSGGSVVATATKTGTPGAIGQSLTRTGLAVSMTTKPYVRIDFSVALTSIYLGGGAIIVSLNGTAVTEVASNGTAHWYQLAAGTTLNSVSIASTASLYPGGTITVSIADISQSDMPQDSTGARQSYRTLAISGTARAQGNLVVADPTAALGSVLIYTSPAGASVAQPPLRALRTAGSTETTDTTMVSGKYSDLSTTHLFEVPVTTIKSGGYVLMARIKHATAATYALNWAASSVMGGPTGLDLISGTTQVPLTANTWTIVQVTTLVLPRTVMGPSGKVRIGLTGPSGVLLDEAWLFNTDTGRLIWVECGTATPSSGGSANRLWVDAASLDAPAQRISIGTAANRSDAIGAGTWTTSNDQLDAVPPALNAFLVATNSVAATLSLSYFPSYHTHVA